MLFPGSLHTQESRQKATFDHTLTGLWSSRGQDWSIPQSRPGGVWIPVASSAACHRSKRLSASSSTPATDSGMFKYGQNAWES
eukprot:3940848-Rhodomonas_salina.3